MSEKAPSSSESSTPLLSADKLVSATDSQIAELQAQYDTWQREGTGATNRRVLLDVAGMADQARNPDKKTTSPFDTSSETKGVYVDTREKSLEAVRERQHRLAEAGESSRRIGDKLSSTATHEHDETVVGGEVVDIDIATTAVDDELTFQTVEAPDGTAQIIEITGTGDDEPSHEIIISEREDQTIDMTFDGHPADEDEIVSVEAVLDHIESITGDKEADSAESEEVVTSVEPEAPELDEEPQQAEAQEGTEVVTQPEAEESVLDDKAEVSTEVEETTIEEVVHEEPEAALVSEPVPSQPDKEAAPSIEQRERNRDVANAQYILQLFSTRTNAPLMRQVIGEEAARLGITAEELDKTIGSISTKDIKFDNDFRKAAAYLRSENPSPTSSVWDSYGASGMIGDVSRQLRSNLQEAYRAVIRSNTEA